MRNGSILSLVFAIGVAFGPAAAYAQFAATPAFVLPGTFPASAVAAGDLNGDGKPDLAVASPGRPGRVCVYLQKEGFYRLPADREFAVADPVGLAIADLEGDGRQDLAALSAGSPLRLFLGSENLAKEHAAPNNNRPNAGPLVGRLSKEGRCDILCGPVWFKWLGGDGFRHGYFYGPEANDNRGGVLADLNLDGNTDVVLLGPGPSRVIRLYYGPMLDMLVVPGELSRFTELTSPAPLAECAQGDLNGDGRPDIVASGAAGPDPAGRRVFLYTQNAPLNFTSKAGPSAVIEGTCGALLTGDVNGDALCDLVVAEAGTRRVLLFLQKAGKPFAATDMEADQVLDAGGTNSRCLLADLNADGLPDLVLCDENGTIRGFLNQGGGGR